MQASMGCPSEDEVLRELTEALKLGEDDAGPIALTALKGMGGIGKTTLAAALANHPEAEAALPAGALWADQDGLSSLSVSDDLQ